ncbi:MAG: NAD(P)H-dependent oxidoreductase [Pseudomonadota bacterium]
MTSILHLDSSARVEGSHSRKLGADFVTSLKEADPTATVTHRNTGQGIALIDEKWVQANFTPEAERNAEQKEKLALSDALVAELQAADHIVIGAPIYNFSVPASLKAWIDMVCRAGLTFRYTHEGPQGLLSDKKATIIVTSGGTPVRGDVDFATDYLVQVMNFIGITDVTIIDAGLLMADEQTSLDRAKEQMAEAA